MGKANNASKFDLKTILILILLLGHKSMAQSRVRDFSTPNTNNSLVPIPLRELVVSSPIGIPSQWSHEFPAPFKFPKKTNQFSNQFYSGTMEQVLSAFLSMTFSKAANAFLTIINVYPMLLKESFDLALVAYIIQESTGKAPSEDTHFKYLVPHLEQLEEGSAKNIQRNLQVIITRFNNIMEWLQQRQREFRAPPITNVNVKTLEQIYFKDIKIKLSWAIISLRENIALNFDTLLFVSESLRKTYQSDQQQVLAEYIHLLGISQRLPGHISESALSKLTHFTQELDEENGKNLILYILQNRCPVNTQLRHYALHIAENRNFRYLFLYLKALAEIGDVEEFAKYYRQARLMNFENLSREEEAQIMESLWLYHKTILTARGSLAFLQEILYDISTFRNAISLSAISIDLVYHLQQRANPNGHTQLDKLFRDNKKIFDTVVSSRDNIPKPAKLTEERVAELLAIDKDREQYLRKEDLEEIEEHAGITLINVMMAFAALLGFIKFCAWPFLVLREKTDIENGRTLSAAEKETAEEAKRKKKAEQDAKRKEKEEARRMAAKSEAVAAETKIFAEALKSLTSEAKSVTQEGTLVMQEVGKVKESFAKMQLELNVLRLILEEFRKNTTTPQMAGKFAKQAVLAVVRLEFLATLIKSDIEKVNKAVESVTGALDKTQLLFSKINTIATNIGEETSKAISEAQELVNKAESDLGNTRTVVKDEVQPLLEKVETSIREANRDAEIIRSSALAVQGAARSAEKQQRHEKNKYDNLLNRATKEAGLTTFITDHREALLTAMLAASPEEKATFTTFSKLTAWITLYQQRHEQAVNAAVNAEAEVAPEDLPPEPQPRDQGGPAAVLPALENNATLAAPLPKKHVSTVNKAAVSVEAQDPPKLISMIFTELLTIGKDLAKYVEKYKTLMDMDQKDYYHQTLQEAYQMTLVVYIIKAFDKFKVLRESFAAESTHLVYPIIHYQNFKLIRNGLAHFVIDNSMEFSRGVYECALKLTALQNIDETLIQGNNFARFSMAITRHPINLATTQSSKDNPLYLKFLRQNGKEDLSDEDTDFYHAELDEELFQSLQQVQLLIYHFEFFLASDRLDPNDREILNKGLEGVLGAVVETCKQVTARPGFEKFNGRMQFILRRRNAFYHDDPRNFANALKTCKKLIPQLVRQLQANVRNLPEEHAYTPIPAAAPNLRSF